MITRALLGAVALGASLIAGSAHAGLDLESVCKDKKFKATGLKTSDLLKAFGKNIKKKNVAKFTADISKAQSKFTKRFTKAEFNAKGEPRGCATTNDADPIETMVDEFVEEIVASFRASAKEITDAGDCVTGPLSRCRTGDYLLENDQIRVVIQDVQRNMFGIGQYGGHIIDADLRRGLGEDEIDNFEEFSISFNVEGTAHYTDITIINDGSDGGSAVIRATGPDDLLDFVNASSVVAGLGVALPASADDKDLPVTISTDYTLAPGQNYVRVDTTVQNDSASPVGFYFGEYMNGSGELELFQPGYGFGETLLAVNCAGANPCNAIIYRGAGGAAGVSYGYVHNYAGTQAFTTSGVTVPQLGTSILLLLLGVPVPDYDIAPNGDVGDSLTFTRYFVVGDGTVSSILEARNEIQGITTGTLTGVVDTPTGGPASGVDVAVLGNPAEGPIAAGPTPTNVVNHTVTDASGSYSLTLPPGNYNVVANLEGHPYQGGGAAPVQNPVAITANMTSVVDITIPDTGTLQVSVDDGSNPIPAKVSVVGFDPSKPQIITQSIAGVVNNRTAIFRDRDQDGLPFGITRVMFLDPSGTSPVVPIEPGDYEVVVSRGTEWDTDSDSITVAANTLSDVDATLTHVIDTSGFVSGDFHVHSIDSADCAVTRTDRIVSMMAEGLEFFTPSDHDFRSDFQTQIVAAGWDDIVTTATCNEMTTFDYGHFNSWPMAIDPNKVNGGSVDHGGAVATAGEDFPSFGNYSLTPAQINAAARDDLPDVVGDEGSETVQINHYASHFGLSGGDGLAIDTGLEPPASAVPGSVRRLDPAITNYFTDTFDALEIWIQSDRSQVNTFLGRNAGDWFNMMNQGIVRTAIADSDTHQRILTQSGFPRTMIASAEEDLTQLDPETLSTTVNSGRAIGTNGPMVRVTVEESGMSSNKATLEAGDSTIVSVGSGEVIVTVDVQSPTWAEFDTIEFYLNSTTFHAVTPNVRAGGSGTSIALVDVPRYGIAPDFVHTDGTEFTVSSVGVGSSARLEATTTLNLTGGAALTEDTWIVVMVKGSDGISKPLFPVVPNDLKTSTNTTLANLTDGNLGEDGALARAFTNPLFVDVDDGAGGLPNGDYDAPGVSCITTVTHPVCVTTTTF
jgi:hypothetical protein